MIEVERKQTTRKLCAAFECEEAEALTEDEAFGFEHSACSPARARSSYRPSHQRKLDKPISRDPEIRTLVRRNNSV
jgi:hypothetical protein